MIGNKSLLFIAAIGAFVGMAADLLLLYEPGGGYLDGTGFLLYIPEKRMLWGHFLGLLFIPLQLTGFLAFIRILHPAIAWQYVFGFLSLVLLSFGLFIHGSMLPYARQIQWEDQKCELVNPDLERMMQTYEQVMAPNVMLFLLAFALLSAGILYWMLFRQEVLPKKLALANPLLLYLLCYLVYVIIPPIGNILLPAGFNLSFLVFFAALYPYAD